MITIKRINLEQLESTAQSNQQNKTTNILHVSEPHTKNSSKNTSIRNPVQTTSKQAVAAALVKKSKKVQQKPSKVSSSSSSSSSSERSLSESSSSRSSPHPPVPTTANLIVGLKKVLIDVSENSREVLNSIEGG